MTDAQCNYTKPENGRNYRQADQAVEERTSPNQNSITGKGIHHQAGLHTYPKPHPLLYTSRASCCEQNRPDGYLPKTIMFGKAD
jgi:hypothetical protein